MTARSPCVSIQFNPNQEATDDVARRHVLDVLKLSRAEMRDYAYEFATKWLSTTSPNNRWNQCSPEVDMRP